MTTFTTEDRIIAEQNGSVTINVEPIPFAGMITLTETAPKSEPVAWLYERPSGAAKLSFVQEKILWEDTTETPLYTHPAKTLTEIDSLKKFYEDRLEAGRKREETMMKTIEVLLKKAQEK